MQRERQQLEVQQQQRADAAGWNLNVPSSHLLRFTYFLVAPTDGAYLALRRDLDLQKAKVERMKKSLEQVEKDTKETEEKIAKEQQEKPVSKLQLEQ